jgi:mannosyltransferase
MGEEGGKHPVYRWMIPILLLAFLLRVACLDAQSMWWDEAFSVTIGSMDLRSLLDAVLADRVHPPLYYLLLRAWLTLGQGEFVVRVLSAFLGVLGVASLFPIASLVGDRRLGAVSAFALAISPMHIWYSQEARMYSLVVFLTVLANYFFARLLRGDGRAIWLGYAITTLLAIHTHYLVLFVIVAQMTYLTVTRQRHRSLLRNWLLCMIIVGLLSSPWFGAVFLTGGFYRASISWIRPAMPQDLFWTIYDFGLGSSSDPGDPVNVLSAVLLTGILAYVSIRLLLGNTTARHRSVLWFVWLWLFLPFALVFTISLDWPLPMKRSIYMDRFLIPVLPAFLILISYGITQIFKRKRILGAVTAAVLLVPVAGSVCAQFSEQMYHRDDWRQAIADIRAGAQSGDLLLARQHDYVPLHYYDLMEIPWFTVPYLESKDEYEAYLDAHLADSTSAGERLWTMVVCENADPHRFAQETHQRLVRKVEEDELRTWLLQNFRLSDERFYSGVYLSVYEPR